jgi:ankyrin repeat protein
MRHGAGESVDREGTVEAVREKTGRRAGKRKRALVRYSVLSGMLILVGWWLSRPQAWWRLSAMLVVAVRNGDPAAIRTLLDQGADPNIRMDFTGQPKPLSWSQMGSLLSGEPVRAETVLIDAAMRNRADLLPLLLEHGADPNLVAQWNRWTALHHAAGQGCFDSMQVLIQHGANVNAKDWLGSHPLFYAVRSEIDWGVPHNERRTVRLLLEHGAEVNVQNREGATPLLCAAMGLHRDAVELLVAAGAQVDLRNKFGNTALHLVVKAHDLYATFTPRQRIDQLAILRLLLEKGADPAQKDEGGVTPLQSAEAIHDQEILALLRSAATRTSPQGH